MVSYSDGGGGGLDRHLSTNLCFVDMCAAKRCISVYRGTFLGHVRCENSIPPIASGKIIGLCFFLGTYA